MSRSARQSDHRLPGAGLAVSRGTRRRPLRVLIILDTILDRRLAASWLARQPGFEVIDAPLNLPGVLQAMRGRHPPDLFLVETFPGGESSIPDIGALKRACAGVPILAMTPHSENVCRMIRAGRDARSNNGNGGDIPFLDCMTLALAQGARGVIRRSSSPEEICRALHALAAGQTWIPSDLAEQLVDWARVASDGTLPAPLSRRETDVAARIAGGRSNKEIARELGLSESTTKKHVSHLLRKLHMEDRLQLGLWLQHHPWLMNREPLADLAATRRAGRPNLVRRPGT